MVRDIVREAAKQLGSGAARCGLDAKTPRCEDAKPVTENTKSILAPMAGEEAIVHERLASVTSAGAGELAAKFVKDDRTLRRKDDKFETEIVVLVDSSDEHESIVGWGCEIADEWLTRGARNEIHICDSNMNGSYEREAISRRYPNNENSIQSYPSPEFLNSLSFIKKFYPLPFGARERFTKGAHENNSNSRHSEVRQNRKNPADYNSKQLQNNQNSFSEIDHASMPLGIFASKSISCWHSNANLHKKSAFTLAEVLITLGIIGVVAALTLPTLIQNNQKKQFQVGLQKGYSELLQALDAYKNDKGEPLTSKTCYGDTPGIFKNLIKPYLKVLVDCGDSQALEIYDKCVQNGEYSKEGKYTYKTYSGETAEERCFDDGQLVLTNGSILMFENPASYGRSANVFVSIDVNGFKKGPNQWGVDLFTFQLMEDGKLLPMGQAGTYYEFTDDNSLLCDKTSGNKRNGIACTARALYDKDFWK